MDTKQIIKELQKSNLYAECSKCFTEFKISDGILFDGTERFPAEALDAQKMLKDGLKQRREELKKKKDLATKRAEITTKSVNIGKSLEKVLPTMRDFKLELPDCRFLGDPIDLITFNGISKNKVNSISFIEVKSGGARLTKEQKSIKDAIEDYKLIYKVF